MIRKLVYKFFPALLSTLNIYRSYIFEARRFAKLNTNNRYRNNKNKHRAILLRMSHGLEKAFSLPNMREKFGVNAAKALLAEIKAYYELYGLESEVLEGLKILKNYFHYHLDTNDSEISSLNTEFKELIYELNIELADLGGDCFKQISVVTDFNEKQFDEFFMARYSVRKYKDEIIPIDTIKHCGYIAGKTPSACNRQPWNLRVLQSRSQINKALSIQNGNRGFSDEISNLVIVTGKISCFSSKERNQVYIDCGMYSMSFILALHSRGISSCALNMSYQSGDELNIAKELSFEQDEVPIMMIAIGKAADDAILANSTRKSVDDYIQINNI